jgi:hypothetical protein
MALAGIRKLKRRIPTSSDTKRFARQIRREKNDRVTAISLCGLLDGCLKCAIWSALPNKAVALRLFEDRALLESFGAKITMGHALGLYGNQTRRNLDILREIRNLFAHDITPLAFVTPEIAQACRELTIPPARKDLRIADLGSDTPRDRYVFTALITAFWIFWNSLGGPGPHWEGEPGEIEVIPLP